MGRGEEEKGRPRKYGPDGSLLRPLKARQISASVLDDAGWVSSAAPTASVVMSAPAPQMQLGPLGELVACASGVNFTLISSMLLPARMSIRRLYLSPNKVQEQYASYMQMVWFQMLLFVNRVL